MSFLQAMALDYSGQNLRGRNFKGQDLEGANFSGADISGTDFTGAILVGANFSNAKAGLQKRWVIVLVVISLLLSGLSGFSSAVSGLLVSYIFSHYSEYQIVGLVAIITQIIFFVVTIRSGIQTGFGTVTVVGSGAGAIVGAIIVAKVFAGAFAFAIGVAFAGAITFALTFAFAFAVADANVFAVAFVFAIGVSIGVFVIRTFTVASTVALAIAVACANAGALALFGVYIGLQAIKGDEKHALVRNIAVTCATYGGTSFRDADLTNADFTQATLKNTDFTGATLTRSCWQQVKKLDLVRPGKTYLKNALVRQLLVTGRGENKIFDSLDLRGVNLRKAHLADASFIGTDLNEGNLQDADLSRAKLVQTQLDGTDFTGATLTGAYIENWGITSDTKFNGVRCEYVYTRAPTKDDINPWRKPDNWKEKFEDGDFADFIKPIVDTLDLYHNQDVDPRAIAISFKQLAENHPEAELRIVGTEVKGEDKFLLRAKTADSADKSELSAEYFSIYNELKALAQQEVKALISEKDYQIHRLENMVMTALERPGFYAQTYNNQGDTMPGKKSKFDLQGAQFAGGLVDAETVNAYQIGGNITNNTQVAQTEINDSAVKTILILASNPRTTSALRLDEEVREIDAGLQRAKKRELFDLKQRWAVRVQDVYQSLLDFNPSIVHFSGHGTGDDGLVLEDEAGQVRLVEAVALAGLFELFANTIECVVLNACYSEVQAEAIAQHIPYVIGMSEAIGDQAAIKFATGFYSALGAGESVEFAYKLGCSVIQLDGIAEHLTPVLKKK